MRPPDLDIAWRTLATAASFTCFGVGALLLGVLVFPVLHLASSDRLLAQRRCRRCIRGSFRLFIWFMRTFGVLSHDVSGLQHIHGAQLVVANHPSLIDVVFIGAHLDDAVCVVKEQIRTNLFTHLVTRATGYISSRDSAGTIDGAVAALRRGCTVVMFPEGTRTTPGQPIQFRRGAALAMLRAGVAMTPVMLWISPPTLARGQAWLRVPADKVHYRMEVRAPIAAADLIEPPHPERATSLALTRQIEHMFRREIAEEPLDVGPEGRDQVADRGYT